MTEVMPLMVRFNFSYLISPTLYKHIFIFGSLLFWSKSIILMISALDNYNNSDSDYDDESYFKLIIIMFIQAMMSTGKMNLKR